MWWLIVFLTVTRTIADDGCSTNDVCLHGRTCSTNGCLCAGGYSGMNCETKTGWWTFTKTVVIASCGAVVGFFILLFIIYQLYKIYLTHKEVSNNNKQNYPIYIIDAQTNTLPHHEILYQQPLPV